MTPVERHKRPEVSRRMLLGGLSVAAVGGLTGCSLPIDPTVRPGLDIDAPQNDPVTYVPPGPRPGMTPEEVIFGFMRAGAATGANLDNARAFLTREASLAWQPDNQTIVYGTRRPTITFDDGHYEVTAKVAARIDADGRYTVAPIGDGAIFNFELKLVDGQWRISSLQKDFGRLLQSSSVMRMYRRAAVHYAAIGWNTLVPDLRWIPRDKQATYLTRVQLGSVPEHLEGAVQTDPGARLRFDAVPVREGVAAVDFQPDGLSTQASVRKILAAQVVATLCQLPEVNEVELSVAGSQMEISGVQPPYQAAEDFDFSDRPAPAGRVVIRHETHVVPVPPAEVTTVTSADLASRDTPFADIPLDWTALALSFDGKEVAAVRDTGRELARWREDGETVPVTQFGTNLTAPRYDTYGALWVGGLSTRRRSAPELWAINTAVDATAASPVPVPAPWLADRRPTALALSPDGAMIAVVSTDPRGRDTQLHVSGIIREPNRLPTSTSGQGLRVGASLVALSDVAWVSSTKLAILGRRADDDVDLPLLAEVGGPLQPLPAVGRPRYITTTGDERDLLVTTVGGHSYVRTGATWRRLPARGAVIPPGG